MIIHIDKSLNELSHDELKKHYRDVHFYLHTVQVEMRHRYTRLKQNDNVEF